MRTSACPGRPGKVAVLAAVSLSVLLGFAALAIDGGVLQDDRQRAQSAADAAALAAANALYLDYRAGQGLDTSGAAAAAAAAVAAQNGFPNPEVHIPPVSGPFTGRAGYAEVITHYNQKRFFSTVFGSATIPVS